MTELFYDTETFSTTPLSNGAHRYAETGEVMVVSWAFDDEPAQVCDITLGNGMPRDVVDALRDPAVRVIMHNGGNFDRTVMRVAHGLVIPPERIHDTMVQALSHGLPGSLEKLGEIFGVAQEDAKLKTGKALIQLFCKPRPKTYALRRATRLTHPAEWEEFLAYAKQDIPSMRHIFRHMPRWNYPGVPGANKPMSEFELWCLDQRINDRGFKVDTDLARAAIAAVDKASAEHHDRTFEMTDGDIDRATQRDKMLAHLLDEYGVGLPDMTKSTLERRLADPDLPDAVRELIAIRLDVTTTSTAKYAKLLSSVSADGRLRGTLQFCGAARTRRDAGRIFQPQNLPRPTMAHADIDQGIAALKSGSAHLLFDNPIKLASNALRGSIIADEGRKLVVADLAQIEARVLPWLAGAEWKLQAFRNYDAGTGPDLYRVTAGKMLGIDPSEVTKEQRQSRGKTTELFLGYGGAVGAFNAGAAIYGFSLPDSEAKEIVATWRKANPEIANWDDGFWSKLDTGARSAIGNPGRTFEAGPYIRFEKWRSWLRMELPSGGIVSFADAQIVDDPKWAGKTTIAYMGLNPYTRQWSKRYTYGGKLAADCLSVDAIILTPSGWKHIKEVTIDDRLWDGVEWVSHDGLVDKGLAETTFVDGVEMTPDHLVLTTEGWQRASQSERFDRAPVALPDGYQLRRFGREEVALDRKVRLWSRVRHAGNRSDERQGQVVWLPARQADFKRQREASNVRQQAVSDMARHEGSLLQSERSGLAQLWRTGDLCLRRVAAFVRDILARHAAGLQRRLVDRAEGQRAWLQQGQLSVGDIERAGAQHSHQPDHRHAVGADDGFRSVGPIDHRRDDVAVSPRRRARDTGVVRSAGPLEQVYDLMNAGPRHRFTVLGASGPMIVHNCTQSTARDYLFSSLPSIEEAGFRSILRIHDEILTEPLDDPKYSVDKLVSLMTQRHSWIDDKLPVAAAGFEAYRYRKDD